MCWEQPGRSKPSTHAPYNFRDRVSPPSSAFSAFSVLKKPNRGPTAVEGLRGIVQRIEVLVFRSAYPPDFHTDTTVAGNVPISILYNSLPQRAILARKNNSLPQRAMLERKMISLLSNLRTMYIMQAPRQLNTFMYYRYKCSR